MRGKFERGRVEGWTVEGRPVEGGTVEGRTVEGRTVVGGTFVNGTVVRGSVEGVGLGAMMVMVIGGGDGTPCIWKGEKEDGGGREKNEREGRQISSVSIMCRRAAMLRHTSVLIVSVFDRSA